MFKSEKFAGSSKSGLNFIQNQKRSGFITTLSHFFQIIIFRLDKTSAALDGFQNNSSRFRVYFLKICFTIEIYREAIRNQRFESVFALLVAHHAHRAHGVAVVGIICVKNLRSSRCAAGEF